MLHHISSGGSRGGWLEPPSPSPIFKYPMKMKCFGETKLFHFHRIFKKNEIKSAKHTPTSLNIWTPSQKSWICLRLHVFIMSFKRKNGVTPSNAMWQLTSASAHFPCAFKTMLFHITQFFSIGYLCDVCSNYWYNLSDVIFILYNFICVYFPTW